MTEQKELDFILILDFDSTFTQVEGLEELADISLRNVPDRQARREEIVNLTEAAMSGEISFKKALQKRIELLKANTSHLEELASSLKLKVSGSIRRNKSFIQAHAKDVYIVSSGFKEFILPVVTELGILPENVFANTFSQDDAGNITGADHANPLSQDQGKVELLKKLALKKPVYVVGDGYTDAELKIAGLAEKFFAFSENVRRERVVQAADAEVASFDEFLYINKLPMAISYPKNRIHVLALENIHPSAIGRFEGEGYTIETVPEGLDEDELCARMANVSLLCIRSKTQVSAKVLAAAPRLLAIGAFCIGTNQIDVRACQKRGIVVFNAPYSNTRSVVELAIGEMIMLLRNIPRKNAQMHTGVWDKSAGNSVEVRGKTLGLVGYGNIGTQLSVLAEALGMRVIFYDIVDKLALGNAERKPTLHSLLAEADVVSIHVDGRRENRHIIGPDEFAAMKPNAVFLNLARGHVVDMDALEQAIASGKLAGAGLDVFPYEPKSNAEPFNHPLATHPNVILTPHIGGSTQEAQFNIGEYVSGKMVEYVNTGSTYPAVNFPNLQLPQLRNAHRLMHVHDNIPGILAKINSSLAEHSINIVGQYLKTDDAIGYVITDVETDYDSSIMQALKDIPGTIKFRILY